MTQRGRTLWKFGGWFVLILGAVYLGWDLMYLPGYVVGNILTQMGSEVNPFPRMVVGCVYLLCGLVMIRSRRSPAPALLVAAAVAMLSFVGFWSVWAEMSKAGSSESHASAQAWLAPWNWFVDLYPTTMYSSVRWYQFDNIVLERFIRCVRDRDPRECSIYFADKFKAEHQAAIERGTYLEEFLPILTGKPQHQEINGHGSEGAEWKVKTGTSSHPVGVLLITIRDEHGRQRIGTIRKKDISQQPGDINSSIQVILKSVQDISEGDKPVAFSVEIHNLGTRDITFPSDRWPVAVTYYNFYDSFQNIVSGHPVYPTQKGNVLTLSPGTSKSFEATTYMPKRCGFFEIDIRLSDGGRLNGKSLISNQLPLSCAEAKD